MSAGDVLPAEEVDSYGNPLSGDRLINCCFPDCGCDGARNCAAENGASWCSTEINLERGSKASRTRCTGA